MASGIIRHGSRNQGASPFCVGGLSMKLKALGFAKTDGPDGFPSLRAGDLLAVAVKWAAPSHSGTLVSKVPPSSNHPKSYTCIAGPTFPHVPLTHHISSHGKTLKKPSKPVRTLLAASARALELGLAPRPWSVNREHWFKCGRLDAGNLPTC